MPPKIILNAPTKLMKQQEYGTGYRYDHDQPDAFSGQNYFPDGMGREKYYDPVERGFEREVRRRLEYWAKLRRERGSPSFRHSGESRDPSFRRDDALEGGDGAQSGNVLCRQSILLRARYDRLKILRTRNMPSRFFPREIGETFEPYAVLQHTDTVWRL